MRNGGSWAYPRITPGRVSFDEPLSWRYKEAGTCTIREAASASEYNISVWASWLSLNHPAIIGADEFAKFTQARDCHSSSERSYPTIPTLSITQTSFVD
jgi:hypothetical protein